MDDLAPVSAAHGGLGLGEDWCWCQMFSSEPVQDSDTDWTPPTLLLLLPRSLSTPVAVSAPHITLQSLTLNRTITGILSPDGQVRVTSHRICQVSSPANCDLCSVVSGVRAGRAVTACAAQSARPVLEISGHVTIADPSLLLSPPSVLVFTT